MVDALKFFGVEIQTIDGGDVFVELAGAADADKGGVDGGLAENPGERHLGEGLITGLGDGVEGDDAGAHFGRDSFGLEKTRVVTGAGIGGNAGEIAVGQEALSERAKGDGAEAFLHEGCEQAVFGLAHEEIVFWLMDDEGDAQLAKQRGHAGGFGRLIIGDADIERLAGTDGLRECAGGFVERGIGIGTVMEKMST